MSNRIIFSLKNQQIKRGCGLIFLAILLILLLSGPALAYPEVRVQINGEFISMDVPPIIENGRTLAPIRAIAEKLGATVGWDAAVRKATVETGSRRIVLYPNQTTAYVDGQAVELDVAAKIVNGRTLLPIRFIGESLNAQVDWDGENYIVLITTGGQVQTPYSADTESMEQELFALINRERRALNLAALIRVPELDQTARAHAADLAVGDFFGETSPRNGNLSTRARAAGVGALAEYLAYGYPSPQSIYGGWLKDSAAMGDFLNQDCYLLGIGIYPGGKGSADDFYAVAQTVKGGGLLLGARERETSSATVDINGYLGNPDLPLEVFLLENRDAKGYLARREFPLAPAADASFHYQLTLWQKGIYAVYLGQDSILIEYR